MEQPRRMPPQPPPWHPEHPANKPQIPKGYGRAIQYTTHGDTLTVIDCGSTKRYTIQIGSGKRQPINPITASRKVRRKVKKIAKFHGIANPFDE